MAETEAVKKGNESAKAETAKAEPKPAAAETKAVETETPKAEPKKETPALKQNLGSMLKNLQKETEEENEKHSKEIFKQVEAKEKEQKEKTQPKTQEKKPEKVESPKPADEVIPAAKGEEIAESGEPNGIDDMFLDNEGDEISADLCARAHLAGLSAADIEKYGDKLEGVVNALENRLASAGQGKSAESKPEPRKEPVIDKKFLLDPEIHDPDVVEAVKGVGALKAELDELKEAMTKKREQMNIADANDSFAKFIDDKIAALGEPYKKVYETGNYKTVSEKAYQERKNLAMLFLALKEKSPSLSAERIFDIANRAITGDLQKNEAKNEIAAKVIKRGNLIINKPTSRASAPEGASKFDEVFEQLRDEYIP